MLNPYLIYVRERVALFKSSLILKKTTIAFFRHYSRWMPIRQITVLFGNYECVDYC